MSFFVSIFDKPKLSPIKTGADIDAKNNEGRTALMIAASENAKPEILSVLIEAGADVDAKDNDGWTALMHAASFSENPDVLRVLIEAGADVNAKDNEGNTPMSIVVEVLRKAGAVTPDGL